MNTRSTRILAAVVCLLSSVLCFTGCTSPAAPVPVTSKQQVIADAVEDTLSIGLVPVLTKNPSYVGAAQTVSAAIATFSGDTITPADVDAVLAKTSLAPEDRQAVAGLVNAAWATYQKRYAQQVSSQIRPDVKLFLSAVANGINRAIAALPPRAA